MQFEVIPLKRTDPQLAVAAINKFFNLTTDGRDLEGRAESTAPQGPIVDGDPVTMQLWVRGTVLQIEQVKDLMEKLEGAEAEAGVGRDHPHDPAVRRGGQVGAGDDRAVLDAKEQDPDGHAVGPDAVGGHQAARHHAAGASSRKTRQPEAPAGRSPCDGGPQSPLPSNVARPLTRPAGQARAKPAAGRPTSPPERALTPPGRREAAGRRPLSIRQPAETGGGAGRRGSPRSPKRPRRSRQPAGEARRNPRSRLHPAASSSPRRTPRPWTSWRSCSARSSGPTALQGQREISVFYLKYAKADVAYQLLQEVLGGHTSEAGGSLLGDMASNLLGGGLIGGLVGGLAGGTSSGSSSATTTLQASGPVTMVSDPRLNALIVEANPTDLAFVEQMLRVIDKESSETDIETAGVTRLIPVIHSTADEVATVVRQVFADRMATTQGGGQGQQPNRRKTSCGLCAASGRGAKIPKREANRQKMIIGVDSRSNSVIVTAPSRCIVRSKPWSGRSTSRAAPIPTLSASCRSRCPIRNWCRRP